MSSDVRFSGSKRLQSELLVWGRSGPEGEIQTETLVRQAKLALTAKVFL
jgi:hypothetical protein